MQLETLAYVGPETVVPVASALASVLGAFLIGYRYIRMAAIRAVRLIVPKAFQKREDGQASASDPSCSAAN